MGKYTDTASDGVKFDKPVRATNEQLEDILKSHKLRAGVWPNTMPTLPFDAAMWWIERQEPRKPWEKPSRLLVPAAKKGEPDTYRIVDPYADRVTLNLRKFLRLSGEEQRLILAAWEDGIWWRGEDTHTPMWQFDGRTLFENIIDETEKMRAAGVDVYRTETVARAKRAIRGMQP